MRKLKNREIIREAFGLYLRNKRVLLTVSSLFLIITVADMLILKLTQNIESSSVTAIINIISSIITLYFSSRLIVTNIIAVDKVYQKKEVKVSKCYNEASRPTLKLIGVELQIFAIFFLVLFIPMMIFIMLLFTTSSGNNLYLLSNFNGISIFFILFIILISLFFINKFYFVQSLASIRSDRKKVLKSSSKLVKENFWNVFGLVMFSLIITLIVGIPSYVYNYFTPNGNILLATLLVIPEIATRPLFYIVNVIALYKLEETEDELEELEMFDIVE